MGSEFLANLDLTPEEKKKLAELGASTPAALLCVRRAAPEEFNNLIGVERAGEIANQLENLLTPEERERLASPPRMRQYPLGARLGTPPSHLPPPKFDIEERDRIFDELHALRSIDSPSPAQKQRIAELEKELNLLLESR